MHINSQTQSASTKSDYLLIHFFSLTLLLTPETQSIRMINTDRDFTSEYIFLQTATYPEYAAD